MVDNHMCFLLVAAALACIQFSDASSQNTKQKRTLRTITKDSALRYLTEEMSSMEAFKTNMLKPIMKERVSGTPGNIEVQEFIKTTMRSLGWTVEEDPFEDTTPYGLKKFNNIIATFDLSKPRKVVIACHFDSKYFPKGGFLGATDSAVPCAIMLETVKQLSCLLDKGPKEKSSVSDMTIQLLFLDGEEAFKEWTSTDSIYGARHLAERLRHELFGDKTKLSLIREFILLDLIGTSDTFIQNQFPHSTTDVYQHLVKAEKQLKKGGYLKRENARTLFSESHAFGRIEDDHKPFMEKGVPIVHLISTPFPSVWHTMNDNLENLDFDLIDDFSRIFRVFVTNLLHLQPENQGCRKKVHQEL